MEKNVKINRAVKLIGQLSIDKASQVLSKMLKTGASIEMEKAYVADISEVTQRINETETTVVGAFIDLIGDAPLKFLFYVALPDSYILADLMLRKTIGTTTAFTPLTESAVQEMGNILASAISNVFAANFQIKITPTPPVVVHDFEGVLFEEYIMEIAANRDDLLIIESTFHVVKHAINCHMYILPQHDSDKILTYLSSAV